MEVYGEINLKKKVNFIYAWFNYSTRYFIVLELSAVDLLQTAYN